MEDSGRRHRHAKRKKKKTHRENSSIFSDSWKRRGAHLALLLIIGALVYYDYGEFEKWQRDVTEQDEIEQFFATAKRGGYVSRHLLDSYFQPIGRIGSDAILFKLDRPLRVFGVFPSDISREFPVGMLRFWRSLIVDRQGKIILISMGN